MTIIDYKRDFGLNYMYIFIFLFTIMMMNKDGAVSINFIDKISFKKVSIFNPSLIFFNFHSIMIFIMHVISM